MAFLMRFLYDFAYIAGMILLCPVWIFYLLKTGKWRTDWPARFGKCAAIERKPGERVLLIHAVSVGEIDAIRQFVTTLATPEAPGQLPWRIVICTTTNKGAERARQLYEPRFTVVRYPLDLSFFVSRFLTSIKPDLIALTELEVWPNFVRVAHARGIKLAVVNGRLTQRSYTRYLKIRGLVSGAFSKLSAASVQTKDYAERFIGMGVPSDRVFINDSMKWDTATVIADGIDPVTAVPGAAELALALGLDRTRPIIVAGSTGPGEEKMLLEGFLNRSEFRNAQLVLVPRLPERFEEVAALHAGIVRRTKNPDAQPRTPDNARVFLIDTIGELRKAYALCNVALVGRSFIGLYGSNPTESTGLGKPTIIGTHHKDFSEMVDALHRESGLVISDDPIAAAAELLNDREKAASLARNARRVILSRQGATDRNARLLRKLMQETVTQK